MMSYTVTMLNASGEKSWNDGFDFETNALDYLIDRIKVTNGNVRGNPKYHITHAVITSNATLMPCKIIRIRNTTIYVQDINEIKRGRATEVSIA